jgi:uncharacterized protein YqgC (DUF456 family)
MEIALLIFASILTIVGTVGTLLPVIPGTPLNFAALLILHFVKGGEVFSTAFLVVFGVLTAVSVGVDYLLPILGAKLQGTSKWGMWGSVVGMLLGLIVFSFPGMILGMFLGAVAGEIIARKKAHQAVLAGLATFVGSLTAIVLKFGLSVVMAAYFFWHLF